MKKLMIKHANFCEELFALDYGKHQREDYSAFEWNVRCAIIRDIQEARVEMEAAKNA
ncbi:MAG: hypothetical protein HZB44_04580 [Actinobacteria bacterium]|nr:hypothetical protein [Actinomycetota bacterium]